MCYMDNKEDLSFFEEKKKKCRESLLIQLYISHISRFIKQNKHKPVLRLLYDKYISGWSEVIFQIRDAAVHIFSYGHVDLVHIICSRCLHIKLKLLLISSDAIHRCICMCCIKAGPCPSPIWKCWECTKETKVTRACWLSYGFQSLLWMENCYFVL